jgi:hypothetical protein
MVNSPKEVRQYDIFLIELLFKLEMSNILTNLRYRSQKFPKEITRAPKEIEKFTNWKANQFRALLLYYGYGAFQNILPPIYFSNFLLLSKAAYILLQDNITQQQFLDAQNKLQNFAKSFKSLYGVKHMTYNIHQSLHISDCVLNCGPLFCYSLFYFESKNSQISKFFKGKRRPLKEGANKYVTYRSGIR